MPSSETICVLALDAADYELAKRWQCDNILLDNSNRIETFTHTKNVPYTPEVWATVATGVGPEVHEVTGDAQDWENSMLNVASQLTQYLPRQWRRILGKPFRDTDGNNDGIQIRHSETNTIFDDGEVWLWPGVSDAPHLLEAWRWMREISEGILTDDELRQNLLTNTGREFGWLAAMNKANIPIAGVHSHILDTAGHVFADRPKLLREYYMLVDEMVKILKEDCKKLVILSDHGIQCSETGDQEIGRHSMRAMVSTQGVNDLPESVLDVRDWLSPQLDHTTTDGELAEIDTQREHLKDLGYL